jgi:hypothetical protein
MHSLGHEISYDRYEINLDVSDQRMIHLHIRISQKKPDWPNTSTLQVRIIPGLNKTTISFHQEKLMNSSQRVVMKNYWNEKMYYITMGIN